MPEQLMGSRLGDGVGERDPLLDVCEQRTPQIVRSLHNLIYKFKKFVFKTYSIRLDYVEPVQPLWSLAQFDIQIP